MATRTDAGTLPAARSKALTFDRAAGLAAIGTGVAGILYSVAFIFLKDQLLYSLFLTLGGLFTTLVMVALYLKLSEIDQGFAAWCVALGLVGALGSAIHGAYDLSNAINPPAAANNDLPSQIDPRGVLTFGVAGLALITLSWLLTRSASFSKPLGYGGYVLAALLVVVYLIRLIVLDPNASPVIKPALLLTGVLNTVWFIWLGLQLLRSPQSED